MTAVSDRKKRQAAWTNVRSIQIPSTPTVGRLMRQNGIQVVRTRKFMATTDSDHMFNFASNVRQQDFAMSGPNQEWAGDDTYVWTRAV